MGKPWSDEENAILREIYRSKEGITQLIHMLPGRTRNQASKHAAKLCLARKERKTEVYDSIDKLMKDGIERNVAAIMSATGVSKSSISVYMQKQVEMGLMHIIMKPVEGFVSTQKRAHYKIGLGPNGPKSVEAKEDDEAVMFEREIERRRKEIRRKEKAGTLIPVDPLLNAFFGRA
jgi:hypothetical protein